MDRDIKSTVYHIAGSIPAANYIQLPKQPSQSTELTGQYLYLCFCPVPSKFFVIHLETATTTGLVVRISLSNLFKECKCTSTWLQFPFVPSADSDTGSAAVVDRGYASGRPSLKPTPRWVLLSLDLKAILLRYAVSQYVHLKGVKLCSNMFVKGVYLSGAEYDTPGWGGGGSEGRNVSSRAHPLPKEMTYPVPKGEGFGDRYDYVRFPEPLNTGRGPPSMSSKGKKVEGKVATVQSLSDEEVSEAVRTESKPLLVAKGKPPVVVKEKKVACDKLPKCAPPMLCVEGKKGMDAEGVSTRPEVRKKAAILPKESKTHASRSDVERSGGGKMPAEKPKVEHVRKAWGIPKPCIGEGDGSIPGLPPLAACNHNRLDSGIKNKKDGSSDAPYKEGEKALGAFTCVAEANTGAEVSDWNESKGTGGGEEQSQEEEEQRQKEEQKQEEEEQRQEKEGQRQEEDKQRQEEKQCQEEEEQGKEEEEQSQEEEEQGQEEEEQSQEEEEDDVEVEVEKGNGPLTRGNIDMKHTEFKPLKGTNHHKAPPVHILQPDPILKLSKVMGFGGHTFNQVIFSVDGCSIVYPCHSLVVEMDIETRVQRFFVGHTDKVSCLALNHHGNLLASGQRGPVPVVRLWSFESGQSLALFKTHSHGLFCLSFSHSGGILCGVGKDSHGKSLVVIWDTSQALRGMAVLVLAKSHTEVGIERLRISPFDDSRMVSCGWDNVRLWRIKDGSLRSCPVNLEGHHQLHFTDAAFEPGCHSEADLSVKSVYVSTRSGHLLEVCCKTIAVKRVWHLLSGVGVACLSLHEVFCITGSEDGYLRIWPRDFSSVFMEIEHEASITAVSIAQDGMKIIAGTSSGNIGLLDASTHRHCTLMRSHTSLIYCLTLSPSLHQLITCSGDGTIRVWDPTTCTQLFDFRAPGEGGVVRVFHIPTTTVLAEHRQHQGVVTGMVFSPDGRRLFSTSSSGSLAVHSIFQRTGNSLLFVGPHPFTITVVDTTMLNETLRVDINPATAAPSDVSGRHPQVDKARLAFFSPKHLDQITVVTFSSRLLRFRASSGELLWEAMLGSPSTASTISRDGKYLFTAGDNVLKVWDSCTVAQDTNNCQVFIGHSDVIPQLEVTADGRSVLSCGDAVFLWDFLAHSKMWEPTAECPPSTAPLRSPPSPTPSSSLPPSQLNSFMSVSPRKGVPNPVIYEPLEVHQFTPKATAKDVLEPHGTRPQQKTTEQALGEWSGKKKGEEEGKMEEKKRKDSLSSDDKQPARDAIRVEPRMFQSSPPHTLTPPSPTLTPPLAQKHFDVRHPCFPPSDCLYVAPPSQEGMRLRKVLGYGLFAYTNGGTVIIEDLSTGQQKFLVGHVGEVSTLAVQHDGCLLTSAGLSGGGVASLCDIRVWKTSSARCYKVLSYHAGAVISMAYSRDDRFLVTVGSYHEGLLALWSTHTYTVVCVSALSHTVHEVLWDPTTAYEFVTVGTEASVSFWLVEEDQAQSKVQLKLHKPDMPTALKKHNDRYEEFTSLCFGDKSTLFVVSNTGMVSVWDTRENRCLIYWRAEPNEIGAVCSNQGRLVTGSVSGFLQLWQVDCSSSPPIVAMVNTMQLDGAIFSAVFDTRIELGVVSANSGNIWYINWSDKTNVKIVKGHGDKVTGAAFSEHSSLLATCGREGALNLWKSDALEQTMLIQVPRKVCTCVAFSPSSPFASTSSSTVTEQDPIPLLCAVGYSDGTVRVCSIASGKVVAKLQPHQSSVRTITYSPDGHVILSGCADGLVAVTNSLTGMVVRVISDHQGAPITDLHTTRRIPKIPGKDIPDHTYMWVVASGDRRVSVWNGDWKRDMCCLLDWLTFPGPSVAPNGTRLKKETRLSMIFSLQAWPGLAPLSLTCWSTRVTARRPASISIASVRRWW
eukprot:Em0020g239a